MQAHHDARGEHNGIDGPVRHRTVPAAAVERDLEAVGCGHDGALFGADVPGAVGHDVLAEDDVRDGDFGVQAVVDHGLGAGAALFVGLEEDNEGAGPGELDADELLGGGEEAGDVHVMATGVHDGFYNAVRVAHGHFARVGEAGLFFYRQRVHVCAQENGFAFAIAEDAGEAVSADVVVDFEAGVQFMKVGSSEGCGFALLEGEFGVGVEVFVEVFVRDEVNVADFHNLEEGLLRHCGMYVCFARLRLLTMNCSPLEFGGRRY